MNQGQFSHSEPGKPAALYNVPLSPDCLFTGEKQLSWWHKVVAIQLFCIFILRGGHTP